MTSSDGFNIETDDSDIPLLGALGKNVARPPADIVRIQSPFDERLTEFRRQVCRENGAPEEYMNLVLNWRETQEYHQRHPQSVFEEIWKFGNFKWQSCQFENLECVLVGGRVIQVSGCRFYNSGTLLRINMHFYLLREFRASHRSLNFVENGIWDHHVKFAATRPECRCLFFSVYPHNRVLLGHIRNLSSGRARKGFAGVDAPLKYVDGLEVLPQPMMFNQVPQVIFLYKLDPDFNFSGDFIE